MKILKCSEPTITLHGLSLRTNFYLYNPNENLAVCFQFQFPERYHLDIQPLQGIVMQTQKKLIKIRVKAPSREVAIQKGFEGCLVQLRAHMKSQYNKKMMEKLKMKNWHEIKQIHEETSLPVRISNEVWSIRSSIKESHSLQSNSINSPMTHQIDRTYQQQPNLYNSNSLKKLNNKMNRQLSNMIEMKSDKPSPSINRKIKTENSDPLFIMNDKSFKSRFLTEEMEERKNKRNQSVSISINQSEHSQLSRNRQDVNSQRNLEIILLALLSGFFLALGSNLAKLF